MADRVPGPGEGKCCPVLTPDTGHCRSADLRGNSVPGATQQAHLRPTTISEGRFPRPARGREEKPQPLCRTHMRARARQRGWGPRRGPVEPPAPSAPVQQASSQSRRSSQGSSWSGKGRMLRQRVGSVGFPLSDMAKGRRAAGRLIRQAHPAGAGAGRQSPPPPERGGAAALPPLVHCPSTDSIKE